MNIGTKEHWVNFWFIINTCTSIRQQSLKPNFKTSTFNFIKLILPTYINSLSTELKA